MFEARIDNDKLVLTPPPIEQFNHIAAKDVALSGADIDIGVIETCGPADENRELLYLHLKGERNSNLIGGLPIDDIKLNADALVEIPAMSAYIPGEMIFNEPFDAARTKVDAFLHEVFNDVASGAENEHGFKTRALVNPAAVEAVEDAGAYRNIRIKSEYGGRGHAVKTALSTEDINKKLAAASPNYGHKAQCPKKT